MLNSQCLQAANDLYRYLIQVHWDGNALRGPDPGMRFNTRVGRFVKSYTSFLPWTDNMTYMQAQGYWIFDNWEMFDLTGDESAKTIALSCAETVIEMQTPQGYWEYPNLEWKHRIATVEGCFAVLGLLECFARVRDERFLDAARRWFDYLISNIGFRRQQQENMWAVNYFSNQDTDGGGVPNNSTMLLWVLARFHDLTGESKFLEPCDKMVAWLRHVQLPSGELPYGVGVGKQDRAHFLCYQYNAFEFMDLVHYQKLTGDEEIQPVVERLASYLTAGLTAEGKARYDCSHENPDVLYYTVAVARALSVATDLQLGDYTASAEKAFQRALSYQRPDGGFSYHSRKNYGCLTDRRSYPRYLSMILNHLLGQVRQQRIEEESAANRLVRDVGSL